MYRFATIAVATAALTGAGCTSAKRTIEAKAEEVRTYAGTIRTDAAIVTDNAQDLLETATPDQTDKLGLIVDAATRIDHNAERVGNVAAIITDKAAQVRDIQPWWQTLLGMGFWGLTGMGIGCMHNLKPRVVRQIDRRHRCRVPHADAG